MGDFLVQLRVHLDGCRVRVQAPGGLSGDAGGLLHADGNGWGSEFDEIAQLSTVSCQRVKGQAVVLGDHLVDQIGLSGGDVVFPGLLVQVSAGVHGLAENGGP